MCLQMNLELTCCVSVGLESWKKPVDELNETHAMRPRELLHYCQMGRKVK